MREVSISLTCSVKLFGGEQKFRRKEMAEKCRFPELCTAEIKDIIRYVIVETTRAQKWHNELILLNQVHVV